MKDESPSTHPLQLELDEFIICQKPVELLGEESKLCEIPVTLESTELPTEDTKHFQVQYLLFRYYRCISLSLVNLLQKTKLSCAFCLFEGKLLIF